MEKQEKQEFWEKLWKIEMSLSAFREEMFGLSKQILYVLIGIFLVLTYIAFK